MGKNKVRNSWSHGYWQLDPFGTGEVFDARGFVNGARAGKYGDHSGYFDVRDSWYTQFETEVLRGVYDETMFNHIRYLYFKMRCRCMEVSAVFRLWCCGHSGNGSRKSSYYSWNNPYIMMAMFVAGCDLGDRRNGCSAADMLCRYHDLSEFERRGVVS